MDRLPPPPIDHPRFRAPASAPAPARQAASPRLRLVGADDAAWAAPAARASRAVASENAAAAAIPEADARRLLAARVAEMLDGGTTARLAPEKRARAVRLARILGVREFDANLVIAIAQDAARRGAGLASIARDTRLDLVGVAETTHALMTATTPPQRSTGLAWALACGALLGVGGMIALIRWVTG